MKNLLVPISALLSAVSAAQTYHGAGFSLVDATSSSVGYASSSIVISGTGATLTSIDSITLANLTHTWMGDLEIDLYNPDLGVYVDLVSPPDLDSSNFNGTYTFVPSSILSTVDEATVGQGTSYDLPSGSYAMSTYGGGSANGSRTDFSDFAGQSLDGTWTLEVWDYAAQDTGACGSWSMTVTTPVPEPAGMTAVGLGVLLLVRRKRRHGRVLTEVV